MESRHSSAPKLESKQSIETEPKTLFDEDMNAAREAALKVINTKTKEEALKIFLEGLEPVGSEVKPNQDFSADLDHEDRKFQ